MPAHILGIDYHLPERVESNADLARENPDWQMEKIYAKSGISQRHIAAPHETAGDLGYEAAHKLLERNVVETGEIDFLLFCTQSPDYFLPPTACILQHRLGLGRHVGALDFNLGCSGYVYGLHLAKMYVESGAARNVLLIVSDTYSKHIHPRDRTVRTLFGDGAAATLIGRAQEGPAEVGDFVFGTDGRGEKKLMVPGGCFRLPRSAKTAEERTDEAGCTRSDDTLFMDGPAVYAFSISTVPQAVASLLQKSGRSVADLDWFVYHQANRFMLEALAARSKVPAEKMVISMEQIGNTVSASIPIAIQMHVEAGRIRAGHRLMLVGFGVGYSWAACTVTWG